MKSLFGILIALLSASGFAQQQTEQADFLSALKAIDSRSASVLTQIGSDYRVNCGREPSVEQYKALVASDAYSYLIGYQASRPAGSTNIPPDVRQNYLARLGENGCFAK